MSSTGDYVTKRVLISTGVNLNIIPWVLRAICEGKAGVLGTFICE